MVKIASHFRTDTQDWTISGDVNAFQWQQRGGDPAGHLFWQDAATGAVAYWQAPVKYLGNLRPYLGGKLSFDWYTSGGSRFEDADLIVTGGNGTTLVADLADPGTDWTHVSIRLNARWDWHIGSLDGPLATTGQIKGVLRDVAQIQIRAEHINGDETGGLDNVVLLSRPEAASAQPDLAAAFAPRDRGEALEQLAATPLWHGPDAINPMLV